MAKYLVIIESPGKLKKIQSFLGKDYKVLATKGHIRDLPKKKLGVDIKKHFEPTYEFYPEKSSTIKTIQQEAKKADIIYLMADPDREGSAIAWSVYECLPKNTQVKRAKSGSITKDAILNAIQNATDMTDEMSMIDSYETRRILDRLVGYRCSYVTKQATGGISAGRVQSAALRILAEREKEIIAFVPQEYWNIEVILKKKDGDRVTAILKKPDALSINSKEKAEKIKDTLLKNKVIVKNYEEKEVNVKAYPPFTTSTLYQASSAILGWNAKKTAGVSQDLYNASFITYLRSDSTYIVPEFIDDIRNTISSKFGQTYLPNSVNEFGKAKNAQEAHEAIRPTDMTVGTCSLNNDAHRLYPVVYKRAMASQMKDMLQKRTRVQFSCQKLELSANGMEILFDGWRKVWDYGNVEENKIPAFTEGEEVVVLDVKLEQKFTQPPSHYSDSSIVKELEKKGIGRPSTFASIISTLEDRDYITKNKNSIVTTEKGIKVSDFLVEANFCFADVLFTEEMENKLDLIMSQDLEKLQVLSEFWTRLKDDLENAKKIKQAKSVTEYPCPKCEEKGIKAFLVLKHSRYGPFYSCENYNNKEEPCTFMATLGDDGEPIPKEEVEIKESKYKCSSCKEKLIVRVSKKGNEYLACRNWAKNKDCKGFYDKETGEKMEFSKKSKYKKKSES